jgi:hypothetical protein
MHLPINVKSPNNISKWHMGFNSAFKGLNCLHDIPESNLYYTSISGYSGSIITTYFQSKYNFSDITHIMHNATYFNKNVTSWGMCERL